MSKEEERREKKKERETGEGVRHLYERENRSLASSIDPKPQLRYLP